MKQNRRILLFTIIITIAWPAIATTPMLGDLGCDSGNNPRQNTHPCPRPPGR
jgi:hypothetical protein